MPAVTPNLADFFPFNPVKYSFHYTNVICVKKYEDFTFDREIEEKFEKSDILKTCHTGGFADFCRFFWLNHTNNFFLVKKDTKTCKMKYFRVYMMKIEDFALFKKYEKNTKN